MPANMEVPSSDNAESVRGPVNYNFAGSLPALRQGTLLNLSNTEAPYGNLCSQLLRQLQEWIGSSLFRY